MKVDAKTLNAKTGHELNHIIQTMEPGMAKGGSPGAALTTAITNNIRKNSSPLDPKGSEETFLDRHGKREKNTYNELPPVKPLEKTSMETAYL